jgi:5-methyltetrahydrofolate corrinoid/iron sulfur protein methyltransferase
MLIIGDRIDATRKYIAGAMTTANRDFIQGEAKAQAAAGADVLNVNTAIFAREESRYLRWTVGVIRECTDLPLCIDSADPEAIRTVLPLLHQRPMINGLTLEPKRLGGMLPLVVEQRTKVIASCQASNAVAETTEGKFRIAAQLIEMLAAAGVFLGDIYIDPLAYSLSANARAVRETLRAIERIMQAFPGVHTTCFLSTASYGLPARKLLHRTFLAAAMERGLDSAILDPTDPEMYAALKAGELITGRDHFCLGYIRAFKEGRLGSS